MKTLTMRQVLAGTKGKVHMGIPEASIGRICKDSKGAGATDLFIPLIGERHDGHKFLPEALARGCRNFLVADQGVLDLFVPYEDASVILVQDTTQALQALAGWYLDFLGVKKIAVTGSVGKTSTRDLTYAVCSEAYTCGKNKANLNNLIGVPMTALSFSAETEVGIIEMGMDRFGEIKRLTETVHPDVGIITNIGLAHIERLGSREGIFRAKMELTQGLGTTGTLIVNGDDDFLKREDVAGAYDLITVGREAGNDYVISRVDDFGIEGIKFTLSHKGETVRISLPLPGEHNAHNGALAVAAGGCLGISMEKAAAGLAKAKLIRDRVVEKDRITIIDSTYNAAPESVKSAVDILMHSKADRKVAVLADMYELGKWSEAQHRDVGQYVAKAGADLLLTVGKDARYMAEAAQASGQGGTVCHYETKAQLLPKLKELLRPGDLVLVKGSRAMEMEQIVQEIVG